MAVHRDKSLDYEGDLQEGQGWWVFAAQQMRSIGGFRRTKLIVPLLWVPPLIAVLLAIAEYVLVGRARTVQAPGGTGVEVFLQMQFYSLALLYAVTAGQTVSHDLRYRTTQLYFSKPIQPWEYSVGKILGLVGIGMLVTVLPATVVGGLRTVLYSEYDLAGAVGGDAAIAVGLSFLLTVVSATLLVGISSTTQRTGFAVLAWLGVVFLPELTAVVASAASNASGYARALSPQGALHVLASKFVSGEYSDVYVAAPIVLLLLWFAVGLGLHVWRVQNLDEGR